MAYVSERQCCGILKPNDGMTTKWFCCLALLLSLQDIMMCRADSVHDTTENPDHPEVNPDLCYDMLTNCGLTFQKSIKSQSRSDDPYPDEMEHITDMNVICEFQDDLEKLTSCVEAAEHAEPCHHIRDHAKAKAEELKRLKTACSVETICHTTLNKCQEDFHLSTKAKTYAIPHDPDYQKVVDICMDPMFIVSTLTADFHALKMCVLDAERRACTETTNKDVVYDEALHIAKLLKLASMCDDLGCKTSLFYCTEVFKLKLKEKGFNLEPKTTAQATEQTICDFAGVKGLYADFESRKACVEDAESGYKCWKKMDHFEVMWAYVMKHYDKRCSDQCMNKESNYVESYKCFNGVIVDPGANHTKVVNGHLQHVHKEEEEDGDRKVSPLEVCAMLDSNSVVKKCMEKKSQCCPNVVTTVLYSLQNAYFSDGLRHVCPMILSPDYYCTTATLKQDDTFVSGAGPPPAMSVFTCILLTFLGRACATV